MTSLLLDYLLTSLFLKDQKWNNIANLNLFFIWNRSSSRYGGKPNRHVQTRDFQLCIYSFRYLKIWCCVFLCMYYMVFLSHNECSVHSITKLKSLQWSHKKFYLLQCSHSASESKYHFYQKHHKFYIHGNFSITNATNCKELSKIVLK